MARTNKRENGQGFWGRVLHVDLTNGRFEHETRSREDYRQLLSGLGLGARVLWERMKPGGDPLGSENILGLVTGLLTDTGTLFSGRFMAVGKSPLSGGWGEANCGGYFAPALKRCGVDGVFFHGKAPEPVYLYLDQDRVELKSAADLWGLDTVATEAALKTIHSRGIQVACIGPAGEKMVRFAGIANDGGRFAARSGLGAVMGSKNLKAVVAHGRSRVGVVDPEKVKSLTKSFHKKLEGGKGMQRILGDRLMGFVGWLTRTGPVQTRQPADLFRQILRKFGTAGVTAMSAESGDSPVKNWGGIGYQDFPLSRSQKIGAQAVIGHEIKKYGCFSCPLKCGGIVKKADGPYPVEEMHKPEYETMCAFGTLSLNDDLATIFKLNDLCNRGGVDTISCGAVVAMAIECFENGLIGLEETSGLELTWGNASAMIRLTEMILAREGLGDILAEGVKLAAVRIGRGAEDYAVHCGGVEPPMHDAKFDPGFAPIYQCDATPGRHTTAAYVYLDLQLLEKQFKRAKKMPTLVTRGRRHTYEGTGEALAVDLMYKMLMDGAGVCLFGTSVGGPLPLVEWLNAVTGWELSPEDYLDIGWRVAQLRHAFNLREGLNPFRDFKVHSRVIGRPPFERGPAKGVTVDLETMSRSYYSAMGWEPATGKPDQAVLESLGMTWLLDVLPPESGAQT